MHSGLPSPERVAPNIGMNRLVRQVLSNQVGQHLDLLFVPAKPLPERSKHDILYSRMSHNHGEVAHFFHLGFLGPGPDGYFLLLLADIHKASIGEPLGVFVSQMELDV